MLAQDDVFEMLMPHQPWCSRLEWQTFCVTDSCRVQVDKTRRVLLREAADPTASYAPSAVVL